MITENTDPTAGCVLGDPFFRNSTIALDFSSKTINLFTKVVNTPIEPEVWPEADSAAYFDSELVVNDGIVLSGDITVGDLGIGIGEQFHDMITFDTRSI